MRINTIATFMSVDGKSHVAQQINQGNAPDLQQPLVEVFGLTPTESQLAIGLLSGTLHTVARDNGIAYETARTHLKAIFTKTGIHRQGDLTAFLLRLAYYVRFARDCAMNHAPSSAEPLKPV